MPVAVQTRFVGMMQYDGDLKLPARFLVPPPAISGVSGELLANAGVSTFACSETQKFGHVRLDAKHQYMGLHMLSSCSMKAPLVLVFSLYAFHGCSASVSDSACWQRQAK